MGRVALEAFNYTGWHPLHRNHVRGPGLQALEHWGDGVRGGALHPGKVDRGEDEVVGLLLVRQRGNVGDCGPFNGLGHGGRGEKAGGEESGGHVFHDIKDR